MNILYLEKHYINKNIEILYNFYEKNFEALITILLWIFLF